MNNPDKPNITIVDRGTFNRASVESALRRVGAAVCTSSQPEAISAADALVLPGVGPYPVAMCELRARGLVEPLTRFKATGKPILGICLGMQLFFEASSEHCPDGEYTAGLGWIPGEVRSLWSPPTPHNGWARVSWLPNATLGEGLVDDSRRRGFYHLHNYVCWPEDKRVIAAVSHQRPEFVSAVEQDNLYGVQFHPEKSSESPGLKLLRNFVELTKTSKAEL